MRTKGDLSLCTELNKGIVKCKRKNFLAAHFLDLK